MSRRAAIVLVISTAVVLLGGYVAILWGLISNFGSNNCEAKVCHNLCAEMGGFASRVLNADSRRRDGWVDCKCIGTVNYRYIPIKLEDIEGGCK
jgi:heme A synthase